MLALDPFDKLVRSGADRLQRKLVRGGLVGFLRWLGLEVEPDRQDWVRGLGHYIQGVLVDRLGLQLGTNPSADGVILLFAPAEVDPERGRLSVERRAVVEL